MSAQAKYWLFVAVVSGVVLLSTNDLPSYAMGLAVGWLLSDVRRKPA